MPVRAHALLQQRGVAAARRAFRVAIDSNSAAAHVVLSASYLYICHYTYSVHAVANLLGIHGMAVAAEGKVSIDMPPDLMRDLRLDVPDLAVTYSPVFRYVYVGARAKIRNVIGTSMAPQVAVTTFKAALLAALGGRVASINIVETASVARERAPLGSYLMCMPGPFTTADSSCSTSCSSCCSARAARWSGVTSRPAPDHRPRR